MNESANRGAGAAPDPVSPEPQPPVWARAEPWLFEPPADAVLVLPEGCVNCGQPSGASFRLEPPFGRPWRSILAPHCARCARRFERYKTRQAVALACSVLGGLVMLLGLPLVGSRATMFTYCALVATWSIVPQIIAWSVTRRAVREPGQTAPEVALWWDKRGLNGSNSEWFSALARHNQGVSGSNKTRRWPPWPHIAVPATLIAISPTLYQWLYPTLVVLNLSQSKFDLAVDGVVRASVGVTSLESVNAGVRIPLSAGPHVIEARPEPMDVSAPEAPFRVEVDVDAGGEYLFAPGAAGYCFWLERTEYGGRGGKSRVQPLGGKDGFFRLPAAVDTWFASNPEPNSDSVSTGGEMVAVRHGRCSDKPGAKGAAVD